MPEGQTFDCKGADISPKALAVTIVAMANADGGMIAIGISDKSRRIEGVDGDKSRKLTFEERLQLMYDKGERYYEDSTAYDAGLEDIDMEFGEGVDRMCRELTSAGAREPQYRLVGFIMKATVYSTVLGERQPKSDTRHETTQKTTGPVAKVSMTQERILNFLRKNPTAGRTEIAAEIDDVTEDGIKYNLKALQAKKLLKRVGPDKGGHWEVLLADTAIKAD